MLKDFRPSTLDQEILTDCARIVIGRLSIEELDSLTDQEIVKLAVKEYHATTRAVVQLEQTIAAANPYKLAARKAVSA